MNGGLAVDLRVDVARCCRIRSIRTLLSIVVDLPVCLLPCSHRFNIHSLRIRVCLSLIPYDYVSPSIVLFLASADRHRCLHRMLGAGSPQSGLQQQAVCEQELCVGQDGQARRLVPLTSCMALTRQGFDHPRRATLAGTSPVVGFRQRLQIGACLTPSDILAFVTFRRIVRGRLPRHRGVRHVGEGLHPQSGCRAGTCGQRAPAGRSAGLQQSEGTRREGGRQGHAEGGACVRRK